MYTFSLEENYIIVSFSEREQRPKLYQFPKSKTVYSFNGSIFKLSEGEVMVENLVISVQDIERNLLMYNEEPFTVETFEAFLQDWTACF